MTDEQQKLVEDNHKLIYWFLHHHRLNPEEYYDILAIGLCKAAITYVEGQSAFSTYATVVMFNEVKNYNRSFIALSKIPTSLIMSYESTAVSNSDGDTQSILDTLQAPGDMEEEIISEDIVKRFVDSLSDKDRYVVELLRKGVTQAEIAKSLGVSRNAIYQRLKRLRCRLQEDL